MFKSFSAIDAVILKKVQYHCEFVKDDTKEDIKGFNISFFAKFPYELYYISEIDKQGRKIVSQKFNKVDLKLSKFQAILFISNLIESVSGYLFGIRQELGENSNLVRTMSLKKDSRGKNNYKIRFTFSNYIRRKDNKEITADGKLQDKKSGARYRLFLSIFEDNEEIVEIPLTRRDIILMLQYAKEAYRILNIKKCHFLTVSTSVMVDERRDIIASKNPLPVTIDFETIGFGDIFLHNQEILNLHQLVERLIFEPSVQERIFSCGFNFRQIKAYADKNIFFLYLRKMRTTFENIGTLSVIQHTYINEDKVNKVFVGNILLAGLYLMITPSMVISSALKDDEYHSDKEDKNYLQNLPLVNGDNGASAKILTREGTLGISRAKKSKDKKSKGYNFFVLHGAASRYWDKDNMEVKYKMSNTENGKTIKHYENDSIMEVPVLESFKLNLNNQWGVFLGMMSVAYSKLFSDNLDLNQFFKDDLNFKVINIYSSDHIGKCLYKIKLNVDRNNTGENSDIDYAIVLNIEKYRTSVEKIAKQSFHNQTIESKFRMPLTRRYLYEFIVIAKEFGRYIKDFEFQTKIGKNEVLPIVFTKDGFYKNDENTINYGIKRKGGVVTTGELSSKFGVTQLPLCDRIGIEMSSMYRILFSKWMPFTGRCCSLSDDGYFCDMQQEFLVEDGSYSSLYAWDFLYGVLSR